MGGYMNMEIENHIFSAKDKNTWRKLLEARREILFSSEEVLKKNVLTELSAAATGEISNIRLHSADLATESQELDILGTLSEKNLKGLHDVEDAMDRLEQGSFGQCVSCGGPIMEERMKAIPEAKYCVDCAKEFEKTRKEKLRGA